MSDLSSFPITTRWPAQHPDRIQLYSLPTPNGVKVSIMLEETGLAYEPHLVDIMKNESNSPEFLSLNPNGKIPAIIDPNGPGGKPLGLFESGAILIYLADKSGNFLPTDPARRYQTIAWLMFQMGGVGPMFGQLGFFHKFAGKDYEDKRPRDRYVAESKRLLGVMEKQLTGHEWIMGDEYTIADISLLGWVRNLVGFYGAREIVEFDTLKAVPAWLERGLARPAVQRGLDIPQAMSTEGIRWPAEFAPGRAPVHAVNRLDMRAPPEAVWKVLIRASEWPQFYANASNVRVQGGARDLFPGATFRWRTFGVSLVSHVEEFVPNERIAWNAKTFGVWVYHAWLITQTSTGCRVVTEETQHGFLARASRMMFPTRMEHWHQRWLEGIAARAEKL